MYKQVNFSKTGRKFVKVGGNNNCHGLRGMDAPALANSLSVVVCNDFTLVSVSDKLQYFDNFIVFLYMQTKRNTCTNVIKNFGAYTTHACAFKFFFGSSFFGSA